MKCLPTRSYLRTGRTLSDVMPTAMTITAETSRKNTVFMTCDHLATGTEHDSSSRRKVVAHAVPNLGRDHELGEIPVSMGFLPCEPRSGPARAPHHFHEGAQAGETRGAQSASAISRSRPDRLAA